MPRILSSFITGLFTAAAASGERAFNSQVGAIITLSDGTPYRVGTAAMTMNSVSRRGSSVSITPAVFEARAVSLPAFRHAEGSAPDAGEFALINLDYIFSQLIPEPTRLFENATAKIYICFKKADGNYEGVLYFRGIVRQVSGDDELAQFSLISDLSDRNVNVSEEITQRCLNELGDARCGAMLLPFGATCSKDFYDAVNGCTFWGQMHAFWGIPFINTTDLLNGYIAPDGNGGGWEGDPPIDRCVDPYSFIKTSSGLWVRGNTLEVGMQTIDLRGRIGTIAKIEEGYVKYKYLIECSNGAKLKCSATHPVTTGLEDDDGKQAYSLKSYIDELNEDITKADEVLTEANGIIKLTKHWKRSPIAGGTALKISMVEGGSKQYVAGINPGYGIEGHNEKPIFIFP